MQRRSPYGALTPEGAVGGAENAPRQIQATEDDAVIEVILVPLDGSRFGEFALGPALAIARRSDARLELLTVSDSLPASPEELAPDVYREEPGGAYLEETRRTILEAWEEGGVELSVYRGPVATSIESRVREEGADLVIMATHGRGPLSRFWLGSVTDEFVRQAPCATLVVRPEEDAEPDLADGFRPRRILVPVNRTDVSTAVLDRAVEVGRLFDARFHLVTCVSYPEETIHPYLTQASRLDDEWLEETMEEARKRLDTVAARLRNRGVEVDASVRRAETPAEGILDEAREREADLVAMATHGRGGLTRTVLGSVADKVLRASPVPVLLHRPGPGETSE